jgi:hypothetical protein
MQPKQQFLSNCCMSQPPALCAKFNVCACCSSPCCCAASGLTYFTLGLDKQQQQPQPAAPGRGGHISTARISSDTDCSSGCDLDSAAGDGLIAQPAAPGAPAAASAPATAVTGDAALHMHGNSGADAVAAPQQLPLDAVLEDEAADTSSAAVTASPVSQSEEQQQQVPAKFTSTLSSVFEQGTDDTDWTPFATSNSAGAVADTTQGCQSPTAGSTAAAAAGAAMTASQGSSHGARHSKGSNGLKSAAVSAPVQCTDVDCSSSQAAAVGDVRQSRDQARTTTAAVRAASAQPPSHVQMSLAHLPQLAPRTR